jgi:ketosteroid isomerase-like protein
MLTLEQAQSFASSWASAWNAHDLDRVLEHYEDDFEMASPYCHAD